MRFNFHKRCVAGLLFLALALLATQLRGGEFAPPVMAKFEAVPPFPALMTAAQAAQIPLDRIDPPMEGNSLNPGDSITALVTQNEKGGRRSQWLVYLQVVSPDPAEIPTNAPMPSVIYTSFGNKLEFASSSAIVTVRALGPFVKPDARRKTAHGAGQDHPFCAGQRLARARP